MQVTVDRAPRADTDVTKPRESVTRDTDLEGQSHVTRAYKVSHT
jgi:hypothetical protein